jgi:hypothetical protein
MIFFWFFAFSFGFGVCPKEGDSFSHIRFFPSYNLGRCGLGIFGLFLLSSWESNVATFD